MEKTRNILIVAGEASGDLHAASLVAGIKGILPEVKFFGLGGQRLREQGVNLYYDIVELAVVGFFEVLKNLRKFQQIFQGTLKEIDRNKPDLAILVDYPGFNLRLAQELKIRNIPIIYYISPQVWAWGEKRIGLIRKLIERVIVIFKFEEELYKKHNVPVSFVGHPLLDMVKPNLSKEELCARFGINPNNLNIALLPGSREKEVKTHLPIMLQAARIIYKNMPHAQFLILRSPTVKEGLFQALQSGYQLPVYRLSGLTYDGLAASDFALVASGSATLETAILNVPMAILYKVSFASWLYIRSIIKIPYIGLVNVVKQEKFIAEFIQYDAKPKKIARYVMALLSQPQRLMAIKEGLRSLTASLGQSGASLRAAKIIVDFLNQN